MNRPSKFTNILAMVLAVFFAVGATSCHSSKKAQTTQQSTAVENVDKSSKDKNKKDATPKTVADALVNEARSWIGTPYKWGGKDKSGADCSGFLMAVFKSAVDVDIPRTTKDQRSLCVEVDRDNISIGDILFFTSKNSGGKIAHVGMYVGDGRMIHASSSRGVVEDDLNMNYYVTHFNSVGRVPELAKANPVPPSKPKVLPQTKPIDLPKPQPANTSAAQDTVATAPTTVATPVSAGAAKVSTTANTTSNTTITTADASKTDVVKVKTITVQADTTEVNVDPAQVVRNAFGNQKK